MRTIKIHHAYRHFKGKEYFVEGIAKDSETLEDLVLYRPLYGEQKLWARPLSMFLSVLAGGLRALCPQRDGGGYVLRLCGGRHRETAAADGGAGRPAGGEQPAGKGAGGLRRPAEGHPPGASAAAGDHRGTEH